MNLSMRWLSEFVDIGEVSPREFSERMTMSGSKVEGYEVEGEEISNVVVGKILSVEKHPDSDHLVICMVDVAAAEPVQIVTGANNVFAGAVVPVALHGSTLPGGVKIKKGKLRGVESCGMLCSLSELGLTVHDFPYAIEDGIFIMQEDCRIGQDIQSAIGLNDTKVEFEITSNRPDCLSITGLAREAAVTFGKPLKLHTPVVKGSGDDIHSHLNVEIKAPELCHRYVAKMVKNIKVAPSPRWMRERLRACGVRPINNIVDITNYVMLEYGQPMHAFDYQYVKEGKIVVRHAEQGESIMTLDGVERSLSPDMLVIADAATPSAVAGVMGGEYSGINDNTNTIVFESACFLGSSVRITAKKLGMRTESSGRFEKGLDPETCVPAILRACELVELLGAGEVMDGMIDEYPAPKAPVMIDLEPDWINRFLGIKLPESRMEEILRHLDFKVENGKVIPPSFRSDIEHKADVAEEIARIYGYDKIPSTAVRGSAQGKLTERQKYERRINDVLLGQGLYEVATYSFISPKYYDKINLPENSELRNSVVISNPLGEDTSVMRTTAVPSMLEVLARNYNNRNLNASLYEIATEYTPRGEEELPIEKNKIVVGMYGTETDYYVLKGIIETLLEACDVKGWDITPVLEDPTFHPGRCAKLTVGEATLGILGEIHPSVCQNYGIGTKVYLAKLDVDTMFDARVIEKKYSPMPKFPASSRDLAIVCDQSLPVLFIEKAIRSAVGKILEKVELFDVYQGSQIEKGKKSVAYNITMRAADRTLTDEECDKAVKNILTELQKIGAVLRV